MTEIAKKQKAQFVIEEMEMRDLLTKLKKSVEFLLFTGQSQLQSNNFTKIPQDTSNKQIASICVEILLHGLILYETETSERLFGSRKNQNHQEKHSNDIITDSNALRKLIEDFEWVRRSAQIRDSLTDSSEASSLLSESVQHLTKTTTIQSIEQFIHAWLQRNLNANCLCACLQALVEDAELLSLYYRKEAFLRNESYATALFICISAYELNQHSLLSQIDTGLYSAIASGNNGSKHKRSSSHPNFSSALVKTKSLQSPIRGSVDERDVSQPRKRNTSSIVAVTPFRKVKSLPIIHREAENISAASEMVSNRPRSKTMTAIRCSEPWTIPNTSEAANLCRSDASTVTSTNTSSSSYGGENAQPATSSNSLKSQYSSIAASPPNSSGSTSSASPINSIDSGTSRPIEVINCDDIKIWTDQSWELGRHQKRTANSRAAPQRSMAVEKARSSSPINSFLCNLFSTPPSYADEVKGNLIAEAAAEGGGDSPKVSAACYPHNSQDVTAQSGTGTSGVFDSFLPIYGKKLRARQTPNLFEDGISSLDYSSVAACLKPDHSTLLTTGQSGDAKEMPKCSQSLTAFLQMAQLIRSNSELEKENAHFRVSEAIIAAMEHMKWSKMAPMHGDCPRQSDETATDWLETGRTQGIRRRVSTTSITDPSEHVPYAELGESCLDLLSAEVVGLSLISKFDDKHLPKVSELKWLVSEEDAPQKLLPLPDHNAGSDPDDHIIPPMTRGTRYWAPPRPQIIFTDHPPPNRRELIQKQSNRCAGCGMRVSPQYIQSFRYCTYLGKYLCTGCHRNQISPTPAKILQSWDFKSYPVSVFAYRLLEQMYTYPLFYVPDLNAALYVNSKALLTARKKRVQLRFIRDFIKLCRFAEREQQYFNAIPDYITGDPDLWSMSDFVDTRNKSLGHFLDDLITKCENHVFHCVLCTARGFICECCRKDVVIFPWQSKTFRCDRCGSCFHQNCWKTISEQCCKCQRLHKRRGDAIRS